MAFLRIPAGAHSRHVPGTSQRLPRAEGPSRDLRKAFRAPSASGPSAANPLALLQPASTPIRPAPNPGASLKARAWPKAAPSANWRGAVVNAPQAAAVELSRATSGGLPGAPAHRAVTKRHHHVHGPPWPLWWSSFFSWEGLLHASGRPLVICFLRSPCHVAVHPAVPTSRPILALAVGLTLAVAALTSQAESAASSASSLASDSIGSVSKSLEIFQRLVGRTHRHHRPSQARTRWKACKAPPTALDTCAWRWLPPRLCPSSQPSSWCCRGDADHAALKAEPDHPGQHPRITATSSPWPDRTSPFFLALSDGGCRK